MTILELQYQLRAYLKELPFYKAVNLFEQQRLNESYQLFVACASTGNTYALFYIQYLQEHYCDQIEISDTLIVKHLNYFIDNCPRYYYVTDKNTAKLGRIEVAHDAWLQTSLIRQRLQDPVWLIAYSKERAKKSKTANNLALEILAKLFDLSGRGNCTRAYILLQDIIDKKYMSVFSEELINKLPHRLKQVKIQLLDLFLLAYIKNHIDYNCPNLIHSSFIITDLQRTLEKILTHGIEQYQFHGILEREISQEAYYQNELDSHSKRKLKWQLASACMGNDHLCWMFFTQSQVITNKILTLQHGLFTALAGNLYCKANLAYVMYDANDGARFIDINFLQEAVSSKLLEKIKNVGLAREWIISIAKLPVYRFKSYMDNFFGNKHFIGDFIADVYVFYGDLLEQQLEIPLEHHTLIKLCYLNAGNLQHPLGYFRLAQIFASNFQEEQQVLRMYDLAFNLGIKEAIYPLIILNYNNNEYSKVYEYINKLLLSEIKFEDYDYPISVIYAKMLALGLGGFSSSKTLGSNIIVRAACECNNPIAKLEIIKDYLDDCKIFTHNLLSLEQLTVLAIDLYHVYMDQQQDFIPSGYALQVLFEFFIKAEAQGNLEIVNTLLKQGLEAQHLTVMYHFACYQLFGNSWLNIKSDLNIAVGYFKQILALYEHDLTADIKNDINHKLGIAYMRNTEYALAEQYLLQSWYLGLEFAEYNLACLYYKLNRFNEAFDFFELCIKKYPNDSDVLYDFGIVNTRDEVLAADFSLAKKCINCAYHLGNDRAIPDYVLFKLLDLFEDLDESTLSFNKSIPINCFKLEQQQLSRYIEHHINEHDLSSQMTLYLLAGTLELFNQPFQYPAVIKKFTAITKRNYLLDFAIEYLQNKPPGKEINDLWVDLIYLLYLRGSCDCYADLKQKFAACGLLKLSLHNLQTQANLDFELGMEVNQCKITKFKQRLSYYIYGNTTQKICFKDLKNLFVSASRLCSTQSACSITQRAGSREKIQLLWKFDHGTHKQALIFHVSHGKHDDFSPGKQKIMKKQINELHHNLQLTHNS